MPIITLLFYSIHSNPLEMPRLSIHWPFYDTSRTGFWITFSETFFNRARIMVKHNGRPLRSPGKVGCFVTAVAEAFAPGTASGADHSRYTAPADDRRAAQAGSPAGTAVPAAADHTAGLAGRRATAEAAGSKVA